MSVHEKMTAIADAIRGKTGKTDALTLDQMAVEVAGIEAGGGGYSLEQIASANEISGDIVIDFKITRDYAFYGLTKIGKVTLASGWANGENQKTHSFAYSSVTEVCDDAEELSSGTSRMQTNMFLNCKSLKKVVLKTYLPYAADFSGCTALELCDFGAYRTSLRWDNLFQNCTNLKTIILRCGSVVPINAPTYWAFAFNGTPFDTNPVGAGGTVYVPEALIEDYKVATNWSVLYEAGTCNFVAIEGSEYE